MAASRIKIGSQDGTGLEVDGVLNVVTAKGVNAQIQLNGVPINTGDAPVSSVNGKIGNVILTKDDIGLGNVEDGAQINKIESVSIGGTILSIVNKNVNIPVAGTLLGLVKSSTEENKIKIFSDGTMGVNNINVNNLVQTEGDILELQCGSSS